MTWLDYVIKMRHIMLLLHLSYYYFFSHKPKEVVFISKKNSKGFSTVVDFYNCIFILDSR